MQQEELDCKVWLLWQNLLWNPSFGRNVRFKKYECMNGADERKLLCKAKPMKWQNENFKVVKFDQRLSPSWIC